MTIVHHIVWGVMACCLGIIAFDFWRSLVQEMKLGRVLDLRERVAALAVFCSVTVTSSWNAVAPPKDGTLGDYIWQGLIILAVAAFIYGGVIVWHKRHKTSH